MDARYNQLFQTSHQKYCRIHLHLIKLHFICNSGKWELCSKSNISSPRAPFSRKYPVFQIGASMYVAKLPAGGELVLTNCLLLWLFIIFSRLWAPKCCPVEMQIHEQWIVQWSSSCQQHTCISPNSLSWTTKKLLQEFWGPEGLYTTDLSIAGCVILTWNWRWSPNVIFLSCYVSPEDFKWRVLIYFKTWNRVNSTWRHSYSVGWILIFSHWPLKVKTECMICFWMGGNLDPFPMHSTTEKLYPEGNSFSLAHHSTEKQNFESFSLWLFLLLFS